MGSGIAQKIAIEGGRVVVLDLSDDALTRGKDMMDRIFNESLERKLFTPDQVNRIHQSIEWTTDIASLKETDFIIEAVFEDKTVKENIFSKLEAVVGPEAIIASNTSSFRIDELAGKRTHPERFIGLHFFYHPVKNRLLEIIPGTRTAPAVVEAARRFCAFLGKVDIVCKDSPGFVVNRFFVPWLNESVRLLAEGRARIEEIEAAAKKAFRLGMGPFELMNVTGVPIAVHAADGLADVLGDFYRPDPLLVAQAQKGLWEIPDRASEEVALSDAVFSTITDRLLGAVVTIAATLIDEGCAGPLDIDLGARIGLRWPQGPLALFNQMTEEKRAAVISTVKTQYPTVPFPPRLTPATSFLLPVVTEDRFKMTIHDRTENLVTLSLARPDYSNALNEAVFQELDRAVSRCAPCPVLVLTGKGKNFAAGADIKFFIRNIEAHTLDRIVDFTRNAQNTLERIDAFPGNVVAVVDGYALGGGAEMMLAADIIVATPRAVIGFPETGIGIYPGLGGTYRLSHRLGQPLTRYLVGTGQMVNGNEAERIGLVDYCVSPEQITPEWLASLDVRQVREQNRETALHLPEKWKHIAEWMTAHSLDALLEMPAAEEWQTKIQHKLRTKAPLALRLAMELIDQALTGSSEDAAARELSHLVEIFSTEDALTGLKSVGKYKPQFTGK